jgi:multidrug resistance efflux pump
VAEGRIVAYPGAEVEVGTEVAGVIARVTVGEKQSVRRGELLAELRAGDLRAERQEALARVAEAEADLRLYEAEHGRMIRLMTEAVESQESMDRAERNREAAVAKLAVAEATVQRIDAMLEKMRIVAPIDGSVEAEVDEFDAGRLEVGSPVSITAEGYPGRAWRGNVEEIPDRVVPRRTRPQDPGRPGDTRVLLLKVAFEEPTPLKLGQRVEIAIGMDRG